VSALASGVRDRRSLRRSLEEHVQGFGTTADGVADSLSALGVRGTPGDVTGCAIARYMQAVVGAEPSVSEVMVSEHKLRVTRKWGRFPITVSLPRAVTSFVREFDAGGYPQLVDSPPSGRDGTAAGGESVGGPAEVEGQASET
jgi:hypothetical protein